MNSYQLHLICVRRGETYGRQRHDSHEPPSIPLVKRFFTCYSTVWLLYLLLSCPKIYVYFSVVWLTFVRANAPSHFLGHSFPVAWARSFPQVPVRSVVPEQQAYQVAGTAMVPETRHIQVPHICAQKHMLVLCMYAYVFIYIYVCIKAIWERKARE